MTRDVNFWLRHLDVKTELIRELSELMKEKSKKLDDAGDLIIHTAVEILINWLDKSDAIVLLETQKLRIMGIKKS